MITNNPNPSGRIGINRAEVDQEVHITKVLEQTYATKEEAIEAAKKHTGTELVYQEKDSGQWKIGEIKEKGWTIFDSNSFYDLHKADSDKIKIDPLAATSKGIARSEISFLEDDEQFVLSKLSKDHNSNVRLGIAVRTDVSSEIINEMAKDKNSRIQVAVALNPQTPLDAKRYLAKNGYNLAQRAIALDPELRNDPEIKQALSNSRYSSVRKLMTLTDEQAAKHKENFACYIENYNSQYTQFSALYDLAHDYSSDVREQLAGRMDLPSEIYVEMAHDYSRDVREAVAKNPYTSVEALRVLANDYSRDVREAVAKHPLSHLDPFIMNTLANDYSSDVRQAFARGPRLELPYEFIAVPVDPFNPYIASPEVVVQNNGIHQGDNHIHVGDNIQGDQININAQQVIIQQNN